MKYTFRTENMKISEINRRKQGKNAGFVLFGHPITIRKALQVVLSCALVFMVIAFVSTKITEFRSPEYALKKYMENIIDSAADEMGNLEGTMDLFYDKLSYEIHGSNVSGNHADVYITIECPDLYNILKSSIADLMQKSITYAFSGMEIDYEYELTQITSQKLSQDASGVTSKNYIVYMIRTDDNWTVDVDASSDFVSAVIGNVDKLQNLFE